MCVLNGLMRGYEGLYERIRASGRLDSHVGNADISSTKRIEQAIEFFSDRVVLRRNIIQTRTVKISALVDAKYSFEKNKT